MAVLVTDSHTLPSSLLSGRHCGTQGDVRDCKRSLTLLAQNSLRDWPLTRASQTRMTPPFQVVDFFCGCGGMSLGFAALNSLFRIIGGCDIDPDAVDTYQANLAAPAQQVDIRSLVGDDQALQTFLAKLDGFDQSAPLVVIGCAPCQGFTSHRKKHWSTEDSRNSLVGAFASVAVRLRPECVIMENVPEMLSHKYWPHFEAARRILEDSGYVVHQAIYNVAEFGVPQERFRTLVMAMKRDFLLPPVLLQNHEEYTTVRQAIGHLPAVRAGEQHPDDPLHRSASHRQCTLDTIRAVPRDGGTRPKGVGPKCLDRIKGFSDVYGRLYWDRPAITVTHYARNPASGRYVHPEQDRGLTIREASLLQSFPVRFDFRGAFDSVFKQIGEAVPPQFACAVAANVAVELLSPAPTPEEKAAGVQPIQHPVSNSYSSVIAGIKQTREKP